MDQRPHEDVFDPALAFSRLIFATIKSKFDRTTRAFFGKRRSEPCSLEERVKQLALESQLGVRECRVFPANGRHVAILGCGDMGRSVAVELLRRGCTVRLHDSNRYTLRNAKASIIASMRFAVQNELLLPADVKPLSERLKTARSLSEAVDGASFVWEAITEDAEAKQLLFLELGRVCDDLKVSPAHKTIRFTHRPRPRPTQRLSHFSTAPRTSLCSLVALRPPSLVPPFFYSSSHPLYPHPHPTLSSAPVPPPCLPRPPAPPGP